MFPICILRELHEDNYNNNKKHEQKKFDLIPFLYILYKSNVFINHEIGNLK
jgi:hypothetical protein